MRLRFHADARAELGQAKAFYRNRSPLASAAFANEIATALARITEAPMRFPSGDLGTHEFVLPWRFPYTVVYVVTKAGEVIVVAIAHQSREPNYWRDRISSDR